MSPSLRLTTDSHLRIENGLDFTRIFWPLEVADDIAGSLLARAVEHVVRVVAAGPIALAFVVGVMDNLCEDEGDECDQQGDTAGQDLVEERGLVG